MRHSDLILLGLVADGPRHAYRLNQQIEDMRVRSWAKISQATVYRGLDRLEGEGYLEAEDEEGHRGRRRTVYRLTPSGEERLRALVEEALLSEEPLYSDRLVGAAFSTVGLSERERRGLLEESIQAAEEKERRLAKAAGGPSSPLGAAIVEFYRRVTAAETWLLRRIRSPRGERA